MSGPRRILTQRTHLVDAWLARAHRIEEALATHHDAEELRSALLFIEDDYNQRCEMIYVCYQPGGEYTPKGRQFTRQDKVDIKSQYDTVS